MERKSPNGFTIIVLLPTVLDSQKWNTCPLLIQLPWGSKPGRDWLCRELDFKTAWSLGLVSVHRLGPFPVCIFLHSLQFSPVTSLTDSSSLSPRSSVMFCDKAGKWLLYLLGQVGPSSRQPASCQTIPRKS